MYYHQWRLCMWKLEKSCCPTSDVVEIHTDAVTRTGHPFGRPWHGQMNRYHRETKHETTAHEHLQFAYFGSGIGPPVGALDSPKAKTRPIFCSRTVGPGTLKLYWKMKTGHRYLQFGSLARGLPFRGGGGGRPLQGFRYWWRFHAFQRGDFHEILQTRRTYRDASTVNYFLYF
jgi:hypothetical protein